MKQKNPSDSWFKRLSRLFRTEPENIEQLINLLREIQHRSLMDAETLVMIEGVILFSQMQVRDVMLPKKQMTCISEDAELNEVIDIVTQSGHSRFPVIDQKNEVIGVLHAKDLLRFQTTSNATYNLFDLVRETTFVPESKRLNLLLSEFRTNRNHMAIVVDEYGAVSGFVTLEDIIEQIIGDIEDEFDIDEEVYIKTHDNAHYIVKGHTPIDEFNEQLQTQFSDGTYDTIGGIVMANFGYLPKRGETIMVDQFEFKVLNADARSIKLLACLDKRHV